MPLDVKRIWDACGEAFHRFTTTEDSYSENIERPAIDRMLGPLTGTRVLDLGCGSGTYSLWLAKRGAEVIGLDLSPNMIKLASASAREQSTPVELCIANICKALPFVDDEFDLVFTSTALHYVEDLQGAMREFARVMRPGASLIASVLHPMATARFFISRNETGEGPTEWESQYFGAPARFIETPWLGFGDVPSEGRRIPSYHHTITDYFRAMAAANLVVKDLCEPAPPPEFAAKNRARYDEAMRVPVYLIFRAARQNPK